MGAINVAEILTMQDLANGHLDVKALGEAANGDENTIVTTRTGNTYPSAERAINIMFQNGGLPAKPFPTKAVMETEGASLADGQLAMVYNETTNNGLYVKTAGTWEKSLYSSVTNDKMEKYVDASLVSINKSLSINDGELSHVLLSSDNVPLLYITTDARVFMAGDDTDIKSQMEALKGFSANPSIFEFKDLNGANVATLKSDGSLVLSDSSTSVQDRLTAAKKDAYTSMVGSSVSDSQGGYKISSALMKNYDDDYTSKISVIEPFPNVPKQTQRIGAILPLGDGKLLCFWGGGHGEPWDGDANGVKLYSRIITYAQDGSIISKSNKTLFRSTADTGGIAKHPMLGRTKGGRIVLIFDERDNAYYPAQPETYTRYKTMIAFSDDNGKSFTQPYQIPDNPLSDFQVVGSTGTIITLSDGRLVCPMYYIGSQPSSGGIGLMYSDNDGATWQYGDILKLDGGASLQEPAITADENDIIYITTRVADKSYKKHFSKSLDKGQTIVGDTDAALNSAVVASTILYDKGTGLMLHGTPTDTTRRRNYKISISANKGESWSLVSSMFDENYYVGYSQLVALGEGMYALCFEGTGYGVAVNSTESLAVLIFNIKGALASCQ